MNEVLLYALGVLLFVVGLVVSVGLHELGHLIPGKLFDIKVTQYFVGFGRTLWSRQRGETEYGVKAIPLGGYVKLVGMLPPTADADPGEVRNVRTGMFAQLMDDAKSAEYEHVEPGDEDRLFYRQSVGKRLVVMLSGVAINIVLAFLLFAVVFMAHGVREPTTTVSAVSKCAIAVQGSSQTAADRGCTASDPVSPANMAGIEPGDRIVSFNGEPVGSFAALQDAIRANKAGSARIGVVRDGQPRTLTTNTLVTSQADPDDPDTTVSAGFLGVVPTSTLERKGVGYVATQMGSATWQTLKALGTLPVKVYHVGRAAVGLEQRDANGPMSVVGAGRVAGQLTSAEQVPASDRFFAVLALLASLNLFLGLFNLVPLPPMDGGSMAPALYEAARRRIALWRHRPDPGFVDASKLLPLTYAVVVVLLLGSAVLIYADIVAPIKLQ